MPTRVDVRRDERELLGDVQAAVFLVILDEFNRLRVKLAMPTVTKADFLEAAKAKLRTIRA
jgi:hypothetical protein